MVTEKATLPLSGLFDIHNYQILIQEKLERHCRYIFTEDYFVDKTSFKRMH